MANHENYAKIGFAVVAGVVAIVATLVYLGGADAGQGVVFAETYSDSPVSGLSVGSDVNLRGVKVGEVREISFVGTEYPEAAEADVPKIHILMAFTPRKMRKRGEVTPEDHLRELVRRGLHATVASSGVTGLSKVELNFPRSEIATREISWRPRHVCIPPAPSMLESFSDAAAKFMNQVNRMDFSSVWSNVSSVAESAARVAGNVDRLVEDEKDGVAAIVRKLDETATSAKALTDGIRDQVGRIDLSGAWSNVTSVAEAAARAAGNIDRLVEEEKGGVAAIVRKLDEAATSAKEFAEELKENPSLLIRANDGEPLPETQR
ncbi:MAG: MlaD family protein [Kiritimatiellae bacterium]|nr:MlaD family protein [Kiritimatiellia bacterium]